VTPGFHSFRHRTVTKARQSRHRLRGHCCAISSTPYHFEFGHRLRRDAPTCRLSIAAVFAWTGKSVLANMRKESKTRTTNHPIRIVCHDQGSMWCNLRRLSISIFVRCVLLPPPAAAGVYTVNSSSSSGDVSPGDGICSTSSAPVRCIPPAALDGTNAFARIDTNHSPADSCREERFINDGVILVGTVASTTVIDGYPAGGWRQGQCSDAIAPGRSAERVGSRGKRRVFAFAAVPFKSRGIEFRPTVARRFE
jgi:hypothetical protein